MTGKWTAISERSGASEARITILMPLKHYHPEYLQKAITSVATQSCPHWQLRIIVEESESDHYRGLLEKELTDSRVEMIVNQGRRLAGAINTGMRRATTDFVALLHADDVWSDDAVKVLNDYIVRFPDIDFFHSSRMLIDERDEPISSIHYSREQFSLDDFKSGSPVKHLLCWKRGPALAIGGVDESLNSVGPDDYDFPWTMAERGATFRAVRECLYYYRDHRECYRLTTHLPLSVHKWEIRRIMKKHGVDVQTIREKMVHAERSYLRQCLYRSEADRKEKERLGLDARHGWRETYT